MRTSRLSEKNGVLIKKYVITVMSSFLNEYSSHWQLQMHGGGEHLEIWTEVMGSLLVYSNVCLLRVALLA